MKKFLALMLALVMVLSLMVPTAFAAEDRVVAGDILITTVKSNM